MSIAGSIQKFCDQRLHLSLIAEILKDREIPANDQSIVFRLLMTQRDQHTNLVSPQAFHNPSPRQLSSYRPMRLR